MAAAQPGYEYAGYEYAYDSTTAAAYPQYAGYETNGTYPAGTPYDGYSASGAYHTAPQSGSAYSAVDPYSGYATTAYAYPAPGAPAGSASTAAAPAAYASQYNTSPSTAGYAYDGRRAGSPATSNTSIPPNAHYPSYEYTAGTAGAYQMTNATGTTYSPYKAPTATNGGPSNPYPSYPPGSAPAHSAYGVPSNSHLSGGPTIAPPATSHVYGAPSTGNSTVSRRPDYYPTSSVPPAMHYVQHQTTTMPYRLPPRGGYQRELDEPGDENALLRHVVYITGLPKEIQNETLAEVFGAACGPIAPVDVRSPKPKIWVYKDRQTREGKGEATITFINPDSAQVAISYFNGKELFGREIRVTLCPRRMYNMQKQNTPFNPGAAPSSTTTPISAITKTNNINTLTNANNASSNMSSSTTAPTTLSTTSSSSSTTTTAVAAAAAAAATTTSTSTTSTTSGTSSTGTTTTVSATTTTTTSSSNSMNMANPIATISSSTLGLPRQLNHSLFKIRQTPEQQRGLLPTPPVSMGGHLMGNVIHRDGARKELSRIALTRGNYAYPAGVRPKPY